MSKAIKIELRYTRFADIGERMIADVDRVVHQTARAVHRDAVVAIESPPKTGRIYRRGKVEHQASAPGEPPATDTGNLANDSGVEVIGIAEREVVFYAEYARPLEFGTPTILPRPFLRPAVERHREAFVRALDHLAKTGRAGDDVAAAGGGGGGS